jgi:hypothetical protein
VPLVLKESNGNAVEDDDGDADADAENTVPITNWMNWKPKSPGSLKGKIIICKGT